MSDYQAIRPEGPNTYGSYSHALEEGRKSSNKSKWIAIGSVVALLGIIAIGVGVGVTVAKNNSSHNASSKSAAAADSGGPQQTDPNDPSTFVRDSNLKQSFYGLAYTPEGSQLSDGCTASLDNVIKDIQLMSQLTKKIRLYGADCNQSALVLEAIKQTKVDMQVYLGNYPVPDDNNVAYTRQRDILNTTLQAYGADHVAGVTVGNEFMLNYLNDHQSNDANSAIGNQGAQLLIPLIQDTRQMITGLNLGKNIPVGNSDAGSFFNLNVLAASDYGLANVHPWFANTTIQDAAGWTADFFSGTDLAQAQTVSNKPQMFIAETGWPTESSDAGNANNGASDASEANLQIFLDTFVCQANKNGTGYFFFEFFDEPWKDKQFGGVEGWWGLFHSNRTLKRITIPDCVIS